MLTTSTRERLLQNGLIRRALAEDGRAEADFFPIVKLSTPDGRCIWLLTEIDPEDDDIAFGLYDLGRGRPELGRVSLRELGGYGEEHGLVVECDLHFGAVRTLSAHATEARRLGRIKA